MSSTPSQHEKPVLLSSHQNPKNISVVAIIGYEVLGAHIAFQCFVPLSLLGEPTALQCFVHISDKSASAVLQ